MNTHSPEQLVEINKIHAQEFGSPQTTLSRRLYRAQHPTEIGVFKCMDGRLHLPVMTNTALGIIQPWRNLGGKFDLGWPGLQYTVRDWITTGIGRGHHMLAIVTYHFAKGDAHRGCRGFGYNTEEAISFTANLKKQFDSVYGQGPVYTIQVGIETDSDALIFHGENGEIMDLFTLTNTSAEYLMGALERLYPNMPEVVRQDLLPLMQGNSTHIEAIKKEHRPIADAEHKEWVLAIGRGFDWLHEINTALIIGPYDPHLEQAIATGASLLWSNVEAGRIQKEDGIVLITSAPYFDAVGPERKLAEEKTKFLQSFAKDVIAREVPALVPHLSYLTTTVDMNTRLMSVL
jgi:hypothetical protein